MRRAASTFLHRREHIGGLMEYLSEIISFLIGLASGWTLKVAFNSRSSHTNQIGNKAGGDMAGGDINKKK
jgi:hypothetical protein